MSKDPGIRVFLAMQMARMAWSIINDKIGHCKLFSKMWISIHHGTIQTTIESVDACEYIQWQQFIEKVTLKNKSVSFEDCIAVYHNIYVTVQLNDEEIVASITKLLMMMNSIKMKWTTTKLSLFVRMLCRLSIGYIDI